MRTNCTNTSSTRRKKGIKLLEKEVACSIEGMRKPRSPWFLGSETCRRTYLHLRLFGNMWALRSSAALSAQLACVKVSRRRDVAVLRLNQLQLTLSATVRALQQLEHAGGGAL